MHTVTFYSYKGGVGRTLVVANVAKYVARLGMKVFVLDFDLEAPGLHYKFEGEGSKALAVERGLVDILSVFTTTRRLPEQLTDYVLDVPSPAFATGTIHLLPAGNAPSIGYWKSLSRIDWHTLFYAERAEGIPLFLELKAFIEEKYAPDFLLIDARTGITEMGGVATTVLSDQVVCMMLPTREHLDGTRSVMHAIRVAPRLEGLGEVSLLAVLSRLPQRSDAAEVAEVERVKAFLNAPIDELGTSLRIDDIPVLHREPALEERERILVGSGLSLDDSPLLLDYVRLFLKLVPPADNERHVGRLIGDINSRVMQEPDEAEMALQALANDCPHPEAYRALLAMYKVRRSPLVDRLRAAHIFWKLTHDASAPLLWDAIRDYEHEDQEYGPDLDRTRAMEAIWRAHAPGDSQVALELSRDYREAGELSEVKRILELNVATNNASVEAVAALVRILDEDGESTAAERLIARHKERMAGEPSFLQVWAERVLAGGDYEELRSVLADAHFDLTVLKIKMPAMAARLAFFMSGDLLTAKEFYSAANLPRTRGIEMKHLGALARDIGEWDAFKSKLVKAYPSSIQAQTLAQIAEMPALPSPDEPTGESADDH